MIALSIVKKIDCSIRMSTSYSVLYQSKDLLLRNNFQRGIQLHHFDGSVVITAAKGVELCKCSQKTIEFTNSVKIPIESSGNIKDYKWMVQTGSKKVIAILIDKELALYSVEGGSSNLLHSIGFEKGFIPHQIVPLPCALMSLLVLGNQAPVRVTISRRGSSLIKIEPFFHNHNAVRETTLLEPGDDVLSRCAMASVSASEVLYTCGGPVTSLRAIVNSTDSKRMKIIPPRDGDSTSIVWSMACSDSFVICCSGPSTAGRSSASVSTSLVTSSSLLGSITSSSSSSSSFKHVLSGTSILEALSVDSHTNSSVDATVIDNALNAKKAQKTGKILVVDESTQSSQTAAASPANSAVDGGSGSVLDKLMDITGASTVAVVPPTSQSSTVSASGDDAGGSVSIYLLSETGNSEYQLIRISCASLDDSMLVKPDCCCVHSVSDTLLLLAVGSSSSSRVAVYEIHVPRSFHMTSLKNSGNVSAGVNGGVSGGVSGGVMVMKRMCLDLPEKHTCRGMQFTSGSQAVGTSETSPISLLVMASKKTQTSAPLTSLSTSSLQSYQILLYDLSQPSRQSSNAAVLKPPQSSRSKLISDVDGVLPSAPPKASGNSSTSLPDHIGSILQAISALQSSMEKRLDIIESRLDRQQKSIDELAVQIQRK